MSIKITVPKLPSILSYRYVANSHKPKHEPCFSIPEILEELELTSGVFARLRKSGDFPDPDFYTGVHNKAYWHRSSVLKYKAKLLKEKRQI
jgi:hypothetical protein